MTFAAVDWSGDARAAGQRSRIWTALARGGELVSLTNGFTRRQTVDRLIAMADSDDELVVGLDFAFSLPAWYLEERKWHSVTALWEAAARQGERWLEECRPPWWGRPGTVRPALGEGRHWRRTELACQGRQGARPKSAFQIGGAGAVGTGSLRGMPLLLELQDAGFSVWPFDDPTRPMVVEIYPRLFTGPVVKSSMEARRRHLDTLWLRSDFRDAARDSEDAFDAALSALTMSTHTEHILGLVRATDPVVRLEGEIWRPALHGVV